MSQKDVHTFVKFKHGSNFKDLQPWAYLNFGYECKQGLHIYQHRIKRSRKKTVTFFGLIPVDIRAAGVKGWGGVRQLHNFMYAKQYYEYRNVEEFVKHDDVNSHCEGTALNTIHFQTPASFFIVQDI